MPKRLNVELELPDELLAALQDEDLATNAKESLVMELLREHRISQGKAAEILGISRSDLFPLMTRHQVSVIDLTPEELREELLADVVAVGGDPSQRIEAMQDIRFVMKGLDKRTPGGRTPAVARGRVIGRARLGGLHHRYDRAA